MLWVSTGCGVIRRIHVSPSRRSPQRLLPSLFTSTRAATALLALVTLSSAGCGEIREVFLTTGTDTDTPSDTETDTDPGLDSSAGDSTVGPDQDTETEGEDVTGSTGAPPPDPASHCAGASIEIPNDGTPIELPLGIPDLGAHERVEVGVRVSHPRVADLRVELIDDVGTTFILLDGPTCNRANIDAIFGDDSTTVGNDECEDDASAIEGDVAPLDPLAPLLGSTGGTWLLRATDMDGADPEDRGSLDNWCVILDRVTEG